MKQFTRRLRTPEERVGLLPNASLPPPSSADKLLLSALRDADEQSFRRVLDLYFPAMLRLALSRVRDRATAEEVIQETWVAALQSIHRFEGRSSVKTWLFRILRNVARVHGRRAARMRSLGELQPVGATDPVELISDGASTMTPNGLRALWVKGSDPEDELLARELSQRIEAAIARLPPRQREIVILRDVEGWSAADACNILGLTDTNQRVLLHRARERIREQLRPYLRDDDCCDDVDTDLR